MQKELERCKERVEEASRCQIHLEEQALQMETSRSQNELEEQAAHIKIEFGESLGRTVGLRQKEPDRYNEMFEEPPRCLLQLEEQISQIDRDSERKLTEVHNALEKAYSELVEKICEGHEIEFELWIWKSIAERLKVELEESQELVKN
ncbi:uncharacterized protein At4g38062-like [Durio zibethinus]|uniref:Uncharacterized protein At4g38062-like n=1 Tax=Durio zibethinus TaxID=66656 RepID=A0A6P6BAI7_DURZI|nr:uncharacterized protein At4g38062-like [Durio zibethinus]